jgi:tetratricopeptide (TPR) repeat protein/O-antigen ligase
MSDVGMHRTGGQAVGRHRYRPQTRWPMVWPLLLALYAVFLWRTPYSLKIFPLYVLDWLLPVVGLGAWLVGRWRGRASWPRTRLDLPLLGWFAVVLISTVFSTDLRNSLRGAWEAFVAVLILWLLVDAVRRGWGPTLWRVLYLVGGVVCLMAAVEFLAWYLGWPLLPDFQQGWPAIGGLADLFPPIAYRLKFTLVYPTVLSAFMALLIPPAVTIAIATHDREVRAGMVLWLIAAAGVELLSLSRGGFLALGASLPVLLLGAIQSPGFLRWWARVPAGTVRIAILAILLAAIVVVVAAGFMMTTRLAEHAAGDAVRVDLWRSALAMFRDRPLTGVGFAAFGPQLRLYRNPLAAADHVSTTHNLYLHTGAELGLLGLLAGAWLLLTLVWTWWRRWRAEARGSAAWWRALGIGAALAGLAAQMLVETFVEPAVLLPAAFFAALILADESRPGEETAHPRRWPWAVALAILAIGAVGMAWDTWGYASFVRSMGWIRHNDQHQALATAERAREIDPWMPLYSCQAGYLYGLEAGGDPNEALDRAIQRYGACTAETSVPGWIDQLNFSALLWQAGRKTQARSLIQEATAQTPVEWMLWLNQGVWAEIAGDDEQAVACYRQVLTLDPKLAGSPFWQQGKRAAWWDEIVAGVEEPLRWQVLVDGGQWKGASQETGEWLEVHSDDADAMAWLGEALLHMGNPVAARAWLDQSLQKAPSSARSYLVRGQAELAQGQLEDAERDIRTALFLEPGPEVHLELARLAQARGEIDKALAEYAQALRPLSLPQRYPMVLYHRLGWPVPLPQVARIGYRQDVEAALEWGALLEQRGDLVAAQQVYTAALTLDSYLDDVRQRLHGEHAYD